jgi:hypothetical protein
VEPDIFDWVDKRKKTKVETVNPKTIKKIVNSIKIGGKGMETIEMTKEEIINEKNENHIKSKNDIDEYEEELKRGRIFQKIMEKERKKIVKISLLLEYLLLFACIKV